MSDENLTTEPEITEITEATVHQAAEHIVQVLPIPYSAAECQARLMTDAERAKACNIKTGNDMQSHFFDVSQRIAKADRVEPEPTSLVIEEAVIEEAVVEEAVVESVEPAAAESEETTVATDEEPEPTPAPKKKRK
jgi:hypothetical protein